MLATPGVELLTRAAWESLCDTRFSGRQPRHDIEKEGGGNRNKLGIDEFRIVKTRRLTEQFGIREAATGVFRGASSGLRLKWGYIWVSLQW